MSVHQYSIVVHNQYSISRETYDIGNATGIVLSNRDRQRVTANITLLRIHTKDTKMYNINRQKLFTNTVLQLFIIRHNKFVVKTYI